MKSKKAVSLMVSYTLLVVIAISLSVLVYSFLRSYTPQEERVCEQELSIAIDAVECSISAEEVNLTLANRGLFSIDAVYVRLGDPNREVKTQVNTGEEALTTPFPPTRERLELILNVDTTDNPSILIGEREIEVQPAQIIDGFLVPCQGKAVTTSVTCDP